MPIANTSPNSYMQINGFVMSTVSPSTLRERLQADPALAVLDVRTPAEFAQVHVPGAQLAPLDQLKPEELVGQGIHKNAPLFLLCRSGQRDTLAATRLEGAGYTRCHVVEGGTLAWEAGGFPVERGESGVISLERQVRIGAGALVGAVTGGAAAAGLSDYGIPQNRLNRYQDKLAAGGFVVAVRSEDEGELDRARTVFAQGGGLIKRLGHET